MRKLKKHVSLLLSCLVISTAAPVIPGTDTMIIAEAHSGRTDSNGGHRDNKNKSGLGSYHYHCGGYPAHLHPNGVCPYKSGARQSTASKSSGNSSSGKSSGSSSGSTSTANTVSVTADLMDSYQAVFDADYYYSHNSDLQSAIGSDKLKLFEHFYNSGMQEGRRGNEEFDVNSYKEHNEDLSAAFGDDLKAYYDHYVQTGCKEERVH